MQWSIKYNISFCNAVEWSTKSPTIEILQSLWNVLYSVWVNAICHPQLLISLPWRRTHSICRGQWVKTLFFRCCDEDPWEDYDPLLILYLSSRQRGLSLQKGLDKSWCTHTQHKMDSCIAEHWFPFLFDKFLLRESAMPPTDGGGLSWRPTSSSTRSARLTVTYWVLLFWRGVLCGAASLTGCSPSPWSSKGLD